MTYIVIKIKKIVRRGPSLQTVMEVPDAVFGPFTEFSAAHSWAQQHLPRDQDANYYVRRVLAPNGII